MKSVLIDKIGDHASGTFGVIQQQLITFATELTASPATFGASNINTVSVALPDEGEFVEAVAVIAGFNFANRVADALAVPLEVPQIFNRHRRLRRLVTTMMSWTIRRRMNFVNRTPDSPNPDSLLSGLQLQFDAAGMGRLPEYFYRLRVRPHLVAGYVRSSEALLRLPSIARPTVLRIGYLVSALNGDLQSATEFSRLMKASSIELKPVLRAVAGTLHDTVLPALEWQTLLFARSVTLHAHQIPDEQILALRRGGLDDAKILDLVLVIAAYNAANRLNVALADRRLPRADLTKTNEPRLDEPAEARSIAHVKLVGYRHNHFSNRDD
jgi:alkylhydroperoxidase family enzyme